jgi:RimJ/RimL family protein N-acetyltransferase
MSNMLFDKNLILHNSIVRLRPITESDIDKFARIAPDLISVWKYFACKMENANDMTLYIQESLKQQELGLRQTFAIETIETNEIVGSTAVAAYSPNDQRAEIGWSFLKKEFQGTGINKNAKFLLLKFGFDNLNLERIEFKTDVLNQRARNALSKIGAIEEGILRSHTVMPSGRRRDTIYYSILRNEWPGVLFDIFAECNAPIVMWEVTKD